MTQGDLRKCTSPACGEYTLREVCPRCGSKATDPRPARFSPEDHYGQYRRDLKRKDAKPSQSATPAAPTRP